METTASPKRRRPFLLVGLLLLPAAIGGAGLGVGLRFDLPDIQALEDYTPPLSTQLVASDGSALASFGEQRRQLLAYRDIPEVFLKALVAVEDSSFYQHSGVDLKGIVRAAWHDLKTLSLEQGASTLTQQLARGLFLQPEKTVRRKVQEMVLAIEIERHYTKQEILRLYCNQVYMGHGFYGLEAASRFYFAKSARDLGLAEAALLAGLIQRPEGLSPIRHPERALKRRNHVLQRMVEERHLAPAAARQAQGAGLGLAPRQDTVGLAPHFVEEVRRWLQERFGDEGLYQAGLRVRSTLDPRLQRFANDALERGLYDLARRRGFKRTKERIPAGADPATWESPEWRGGIRSGGVVEGVVTEVTTKSALVRIGSLQGALDRESVEWTGQADLSRLVRVGDRIRVRLLDATADGHAKISLEQEPSAEAALIAIEPSTGAVRALIGGFDFKRSEFDRAVQARRQAGSAFKPFVYAAALSQGLPLSRRILDEPTVFLDPTTWNPYQPENYDSAYRGLLTLREALEASRNIATVKLLLDVGFPAVIDTARGLGITTALEPYPSLALGAFEVSLLELTSAYGAFANQGVRVAPHFVEEVRDRDNRVVERAEPEVKDAVSPQIAFMMNHLLKGVISDGTGAAASSLGRPLAGKTGTTDDFTDAWFIGYAPDLVVGVWVGHDTKKSLGGRETGAQAALPIWQAFMERAYEGVPPQDFPVPDGVTMASIDRTTGLKANAAAGCEEVFTEGFLAGTEPIGYCSPAEHARLLFPYPFQRYALNEEGELLVPDADLDDLLGHERGVGLEGNKITVAGERGPASLRVRRTSAAPETPLPAEVAGRAPATGWRGSDGRPARVIVLGR